MGSGYRLESDSRDGMEGRAASGRRGGGTDSPLPPATPSRATDLSLPFGAGAASGATGFKRSHHGSTLSTAAEVGGRLVNVQVTLVMFEEAMVLLTRTSR